MKHASIMIVEKDADLRNSLRHAFEDRGYITWTCPAQEIAVSIFPAAQPSVVLLDLDMDGTNPMRLIDAWVQMAPQTRVIVESKSADITRMREALDHGAHAFLIKPFSLMPLFDLLEKDIPPYRPGAAMLKKAA